MDGQFCAVRLIHRIGQQSLHYEKKQIYILYKRALICFKGLFTLAIFIETACFCVNGDGLKN